MSEAQLIKPDREIVNQLRGSGADTLKKCFQCGTCTVVCNLSPDGDTFPRRQMIWSQWGLKDRLLADPNIWLCHQCTDCSTYCPRGARPGDVFSALRQLAIREYATPKFMGKFMSDEKYLPALFAVPAILLLIVLAVTGRLALPQGEVEFAHMYSHLVLNLFFPAFTGLAALAFAAGAIKMWHNWDPEMPELDLGNPIGSATGALGYVTGRLDKLIAATITVIKDLLTHKNFNECEANKIRYYSHMLVFYGFIGLLITTALAVGVIIFQDFLRSTLLGEYPLKLIHPIKWLGNASGIALIIGLLIMIKNRQDSVDDMNSSYFDWLFIYILLAVACTGILAQLFRFADIAAVAYPVYFVHLVCVFSLLIYSPYSKFAHFVYRTLALIFIEYRKLANAEEGASEEAA